MPAPADGSSAADVANSDAATPSDTTSGEAAATNTLFVGAIFGLLSSLGYTAANVGLREVSFVNPVWVAFIKSLPTIALALPWMMFAIAKGRAKLPPARVLAMLVGGGIAGQIGGNICFQWSLDVIGLALAVPLTTGSLIVAGAIMARVLLGETMSTGNLVANGIMIFAVCVLSLGAPGALAAIKSTTGSGNWQLAMLGVLAACAPGIGYSLQNIAIRRALIKETHVAVALLTVSTTGAIVAYAWIQATVGIASAASSTDFSTMTIMVTAGICNAAAFVALSEALRRTPISFLYALSSSQVAMAAICGVWLFDERLSFTLIAGSFLTIVGLAVMRATSKNKKK
jgi:DME family drug/metabolite transporter